MKKFKKINNEVYYTEKKITQIDDKDILFLKSNVHKTKKKEFAYVHILMRKIIFKRCLLLYQIKHT